MRRSVTFTDTVTQAKLKSQEGAEEPHSFFHCLSCYVVFDLYFLVYGRAEPFEKRSLDLQAWSPDGCGRVDDWWKVERFLLDPFVEHFGSFWYIYAMLLWLF